MPGPRPRAYDLAAAALVALCTSGAAHAAVHDVHTHRFENGLTLHVASGHPAPVAAVQAWVGVGSTDEAAHEAGIAHVVEHMLFKGSAGYGLGELVRAIERGGGEINAWTGFDHTVYHAVLAADHVDGAIHALGDALIEPLVDPGELAREREVILEEIRQGSDDPARSVAQSLFATAYVAHPYRRPVIGTADSVRRIGERELVEFFRSYYVADNLTLIVAGDVDPERVQRSVGRRFRAMPSGRPVRRVAVEPPQTEPRATCVHREVGEAHLAVGFHVPAIRHSDVAALDVAAILLGQSESARLPRLLRDRDHRVTSAHASLHALRDPGLLVLSATAARGDTPSTIAALVDHGAALAGELVPGDLDKARISVEAAFVRQLETAQGRARSLGWHATVAGDPQFGHVYLDRIRAVRRHDVARVMARYLRPGNASVAAILPATRRAPRTAWARRAERRVAQALASTVAPVPPVERRIVLASGVTVLVRRDPSVPIVAMRAVWRGGQRSEDPAHAGASTLLARMLTRGCGKRDAQATADQIDRLGGALTGIAGRNSFGVAAEWLAASWRPGLDLLADCILEPALASGELVRERRLLLDDQRAQLDSPSHAVFRLFSEALYGAHPYARDVLGTADAVGALSRAGLAAFHRARYPVSAMTLAIAGDIEIDEVVAAVEQRFGAVPRGRAAAPPVPAVPALALDGRSASDREVYRYLERAQAHLVIGFPGATVDAADRFALEVLVAILGGQSGRLFAELRERQALAYRVSAHSIEGFDPGFVAIYLSCAPDKLGAAVAGVRDQLALLRADGVTAAEVERAQSHLIGGHRIAMQRRAAIANAMAYHEAYGLGWQSWAGYDAAIRAVTPAEVAAAIATYLRDDRAITATVRPPGATPAATRRSKLRNMPTGPTGPTPPPAKRPAKRPARSRGRV
jgi:zinc protease